MLFVHTARRSYRLSDSVKGDGFVQSVLSKISNSSPSATTQKPKQHKLLQIASRKRKIVRRLSHGCGIAKTFSNCVAFLRHNNLQQLILRMQQFILLAFLGRIGPLQMQWLVIVKSLTFALARGWPTFLRNCSREHAIVSISFATVTARLAGAGLGLWKAGQERQTGLPTTAPRVHDTERNDTQETKIWMKRLLTNNHHFLSGDQAHEAGGAVGHDAGLLFQSSGHRQHRLGGETFRVQGHWLVGLMLLVAQGAISSRLGCAQTTRATFARKHALLRRESTTAALYCCRHDCERVAIPTRSQP